MSSSTATRRQYAIPCPGCGTAISIEEGGPETDRRTCSGCGNLLMILRTETVFMATIPFQQKGCAD